MQTLAPKLKRAFVLWLAVFPAITAILAVLDPLVGAWPLALRTLLLTVIMIPLVQFVLMPMLMELLGDWVKSRVRKPRKEQVYQQLP